MSAHLVTKTTGKEGETNFKTINPTPSQQHQLSQLRPEFEKAFGVDQETRTKDQWRNLVRQYGLYQVCMIEKMDKEKVMKKMGY